MRQSQNAGILAALKEGARIADLRKMGYKVKTRIVSRNRKNYAEYYLEAN